MDDLGNSAGSEIHPHCFHGTVPRAVHLFAFDSLGAGRLRHRSVDDSGFDEGGFRPAGAIERALDGIQNTFGEGWILNTNVSHAVVAISDTRGDPYVLLDYSEAKLV